MFKKRSSVCSPSVLEVSSVAPGPLCVACCCCCSDWLGGPESESESEDSSIELAMCCVGRVVLVMVRRVVAGVFVCCVCGV
jgi:streptolysin S family bacteriocin protoxin